MKTLSSSEIKKLPYSKLKYYMEHGILEVMNAQPIPTRIEETPEFKKQAKLIGTPIHMREACRKYKIALSTMHRWVDRGLIKKLAPDKNKIMLDEAYVAYAVDILRSHPDSKGRWLFDMNGTPYIKITQ